MTATFIKFNPLPGSRSLDCEARGLEELRKYQKQHGLNIPKVLEIKEDELHLEKITPKRPRREDWAFLGEGLARLHQIFGRQFGFEFSNFIGLNEQINTVDSDWGEFFTSQRIEYQLELLRDTALKARLKGILSEKRKALVHFLNSHNPKPSLVHGDLWSGNVMFDERGPWLIDPAVYYGDREVDIAMTKMFGGFDGEFYKAYEATWPLTEGHEKRSRIYNLYHYLNHLNLFGAGYRRGVEEGFETIKNL